MTSVKIIFNVRIMPSVVSEKINMGHYKYTYYICIIIIGTIIIIIAIIVVLAQLTNRSRMGEITNFQIIMQPRLQL